VAKKGEKLKDIARRFKVSFEELKKMNPTIKTNVLQEETKIRIK
jgi:LysM repeat protein